MDALPLTLLIDAHNARHRASILWHVVLRFPAEQLPGMGEVPEPAGVVGDAVDDRERHVLGLDAVRDQLGTIAPAQPGRACGGEHQLAMSAVSSSPAQANSTIGTTCKPGPDR